MVYVVADTFSHAIGVAILFGNFDFVMILSGITLMLKDILE